MSNLGIQALTEALVVYWLKTIWDRAPMISFEQAAGRLFQAIGPSVRNRLADPSLPNQRDRIVATIKDYALQYPELRDKIPA